MDIFWWIFNCSVCNLSLSLSLSYSLKSIIDVPSGVFKTWWTKKMLLKMLRHIFAPLIFSAAWITIAVIMNREMTLFSPLASQFQQIPSFAPSWYQSSARKNILKSSKKEVEKQQNWFVLHRKRERKNLILLHLFVIAATFHHIFILFSHSLTR